VALSIGLAVLAVGFLRLLQGETGSTFTGNLSWIPYVICAVLVVGIAAIAVKAVSRARPRTQVRQGAGMSAAEQKITRDQIEAKLREVTGGVSDEVEGSSPRRWPSASVSSW